LVNIDLGLLQSARSSGTDKIDLGC